MNNNIDNRGAVSVEASVILPLFLFTMMFFIYLCNVNTVKGVIYEGCIETAEYMAEYAYLTDRFETTEFMNSPIAALKFREYVDDKALLDKYVVGGINGISFIGSEFPDIEGYIDLKVTYYVSLKIPIIGNFKRKYTEHIKQRAYLGKKYKEEEKSDKNVDRYVFIAKNGIVYHETRNCTYLSPKICSSSKSAAEAMGYKPCRYCSSYIGEDVFITTNGDCYHADKKCSRIKRTVFRRKLSEVNLPPCSKCGY